MSTTLATWYAAILHVAGIAVLGTLIALGKGDGTTELTLLTGLLGVGVGAGLTSLSPSSAPTTAAAPALAPGPAAVVPHLAGADA